MTNYIPDVNKYKLAGPPEWWLRMLWDFDSSLVVVPSRQGFYYRLAQRRKLKLADRFVHDMMKEHGDSSMLASYSLVPVTTITATATWSPLMFKELEERAPWRMGGADKVIKNLEDAEWENHKMALKRNDERMTDYAKFGWRVYQGKTGQRTRIDSTKRMTTPTDTPKIILAS